MSSIHVCTSPEDFPGERVRALTTGDWTTLGWTARPDDRRGASLLADGLEATGVDWRLSPVRRLETDEDRRHLIARCTSAGTHTLVLGNGHWTTQTSRRLIMGLAAEIGADLYLCYTDGEGTNAKNSGVLDDAAVFGWPVYAADEFPLPRPTPASPSSQTPNSVYQAQPPVPTVGFTMYRHWCKKLLSGAEFAHLDRWYHDAYTAAGTIDPHDRVSVAQLAIGQLADVGRAEAITRLRAMQAALFRRGVVWNLPISALDSWRRHQYRPVATPADYARLSALATPRTAAAAVLASVGLRAGDMGTITSADITGEPGTPTAGLGAQALRMLDVFRRYTDGQLFSGIQSRVIASDIKFLNFQFGFPLPDARGGSKAPRAHLDPDSLDLREVGAPQ